MFKGAAERDSDSDERRPGLLLKKTEVSTESRDEDS